MKRFIIAFVVLLAVAISFDTANADHLDLAKKVNTQGSVEDRTRLVNDLLRGYNKKVNPDKVTVKFGVSLINYDISEERQAMDSYVWLKEVWDDSRLAWSTKTYNVDVLRLDPDLIWKPDITVYNSADPVHVGGNCWSSNVLVYPTGTVLWVPPCKIQSYCENYLHEHPYGEQTCSLKFGSWTFDKSTLDLQLYGKEKGEQPFDLSDLQNSTIPYEVVSVASERKDAYYPCCVESYPYVNFNLTVKRLSPGELLNRFSE